MGVADLAGLYRRAAGDGAWTLCGGHQSAKHTKEDWRHRHRLAPQQAGRVALAICAAIHLLRRVFEEAADFADARHMLESTPICTPVIYTLAGLNPSEACVIERRETSARVLLGSACTANEWQTADWRPGHFAAFENAKRLRAMQALPGALDLSWLQWLILNSETRLAFAADPAQGHMIARGYESGGPATRPLEMFLASGAAEWKIVRR
jgi:hypothetical protein